MASIVIYPADTCIRIVCGAGETLVSVDVADIYKAWKDWFVLSDNSKYLPAFDAAGGEPLGGSEALGRAYFLLTGNGWRICPDTVEPEVRLILQGNLFSAPAGDPLFSYDYVVASGHTHIEMRTSTLPSIYETGVSGLTPDEANKLNLITTVNALNEQILKLTKLIPACIK